MKPYQKLLDRWASQDPPYARDVLHGEAEVAALERRYGVRAPEDFRDYLLHACPTSEQAGDMDEDGNSWWGLDRIVSISEEFEGPLDNANFEAEAPKALFFADHLIWCWAWAICCADGPNYGRVLVVNGPHSFVAASFSDFVDAYVANAVGGSARIQRADA